MGKLNEIIGNIRKKYGKEIIGSLKETEREYSRIPFKTLSLGYLFRGGLPRTICELIGMPSSGKSTTCYSICGEAQKVFKQEYEDEVAQLQSLTKPTKEDKERLEYLLDRGYQRVVFLDHEFTSSREWMELNGVDVDDLIYIRPQGESAEELFQMLLDLAATGEVGCIILDSIPAMVSFQAQQKTMDEKTYGGISAPLTIFCSKFMPLQKKYNILFIGVNVPKQDMSGYNRLITSGGNYFKHTCSIRLLFKRGDFYDNKYAPLKAHPDEAYGNYTEVEVIKNKACKPDRRMCKFSITYDIGIDGFNDCINMAITFGLIKKAGAWFSIVDENGETVKHDNGDLMKWQGLANVIKYMQEHEEVYKEVYDKVNELITKD